MFKAGRVIALRLAVLLAAGGLSVAALAQEDAGSKKPTNVLRGVLLRPTGEPAAGVKVVLAHAEKAKIWFGDGEVYAYGPRATFWGFFARRNGLTVCDTTTDAEGHFTLSDFRNPKSHYHLAFSYEQELIGVRTNIVPAEYQDAELRIVARPAAYFKAELKQENQEDPRYRAAELELLPPLLERQKERPEDRINFWVDVLNYEYSQWGRTVSQPSGRPKKFGPFPGGHEYRLTLEEWRSDVPFAVTVLGRKFHLGPGQTVDVAAAPNAGATLAGRVLGKDGQPMAGVNVMVEMGADAELIIGTVSDGEGKYELCGIRPGTHKLKLLRYAIRTAPG